MGFWHTLPRKPNVKSFLSLSFYRALVMTFLSVAVVFAPLALAGGAELTVKPDPISYQGHLMNGGVPVTGIVPMTFRLVDEQGGCCWGSLTMEVSVSEGLFQVELDFSEDEGGGYWTIPFEEEPLWLEVIVDGQVLSPRQRISAVPVALRALTFDLPNDSVEPKHLIQSAVTSVKIAPGAVINNKIAAGAVTNDKIAAGAISNNTLDTSIRRRWARVRAHNQTLIHQRGALGVVRTGTGRYRVQFDRDVTTCAVLASLNHLSSDANEGFNVNGYAVAGPGSGAHADKVIVETFLGFTASHADNLDFHVMVEC